MDIVINLLFGHENAIHIITGNNGSNGSGAGAGTLSSFYSVIKYGSLSPCKTLFSSVVAPNLRFLKNHEQGFVEDFINFRIN